MQHHQNHQPPLLRSKGTFLYCKTNHASGISRYATYLQKHVKMLKYHVAFACVVGGIPSPLKKIWVCHLGLFFPIYGKIKNVPNHQPMVLFYLHNPKDIICGLLKMVDPQVTMNVSMLKLWSNPDDLGVPPFNLRKLHTCIHICIYRQYIYILYKQSTM